ncbi:tannase/feruloyl esterase family alpha/beta hydrolase [Sorangium sp. So ce131]|uniref:tannase/feruloyl esterase family alpha/beta hydrolase n=1 Tax=Sorangium sp. So ce131 TaxID=3133282 RepID=UPI003F600627
MALGLTAMLEALSAPGAFPSAAKRKLVWDAVLDECDALDGLADGVIGDVVSCSRQLDVTALRCAGGADAGDACLSDAQIQAFEAIDAPVRLASPLASGDAELAGYNVYSAAQGVGTDSPLEPHVQSVDFGSQAPSFPVDSAGRLLLSRVTAVPPSGEPLIVGVEGGWARNGSTSAGRAAITQCAGTPCGGTLYIASSPLRAHDAARRRSPARPSGSRGAAARAEEPSLTL